MNILSNMHKDEWNARYLGLFILRRSGWAVRRIQKCSGGIESCGLPRISAAIGSYADGKRVAKVSDVERNFRAVRHKDVAR